MNMKPDYEFWKTQRVLITGHTGFKGTWLSLWLNKIGTSVAGYALEPYTTPSFFDLISNKIAINSIIDDIANYRSIDEVIQSYKPTIILHMAAQPLVRKSYIEPRQTFESNVMGTVNLLEAACKSIDVKAVLVVTTDKVYKNEEIGKAFIESDTLGGHDPYSCSKAICEEIVNCYRENYFEKANIKLVSARAGNVIGGGDWSDDRLIPDIWRSLDSGKKLILRYPNSVRPWQHVLEPLSGYLKYIEAIFADTTNSLPNALNFSMVKENPIKVHEIVEIFANKMKIENSWEQDKGDFPREMGYLNLDSSLALNTIGWKSILEEIEAVDWTAEWFRAFSDGTDILDFSLKQINDYESKCS